MLLLAYLIFTPDADPAEQTGGVDAVFRACVACRPDRDRALFLGGSCRARFLASVLVGMLFTSLRGDGYANGSVSNEPFESGTETAAALGFRDARAHSAPSGPTGDFQAVAKRSRRPVTPRPSTTPPSSQTRPSSTPAPDSSDASESRRARRDEYDSGVGQFGRTPPPIPTSRPRPTRPKPANSAATRGRYRSRASSSASGPRSSPASRSWAWRFLAFSTSARTRAQAALSPRPGPKYLCDTLLTPGPVETTTPQPPTLPPTPTPATPQPGTSASAAPSRQLDRAPSPPMAEPPCRLRPQRRPPAPPSAASSPTAVPTEAPPPTPRLGFTTTILGRNHILNANQTIEYGFCPPTSGDHYNISGVGPIRAAVYPNTAEQPPGGWVHNLEHGWVVLLYSCKNGCPSADEMAQMHAVVRPGSALPIRPRTRAATKEVLVARFDSMTTRFALVAWGRALPDGQFRSRHGATRSLNNGWTTGPNPKQRIC